MSNTRITVGNVSFEQINGAWIAEDTVIGNNVTIFPGAVLGRPPVSTKAQVQQVDRKPLLPLKIGNNCVIGANTVIYRETEIGNDCLVGDTATVRERVRIGDRCIVAMNVTIDHDTTIGTHVKIMNNTYLTANMLIEDDVFFGPLVSTTTDNSIGREAALNVPLELRKRQGPILRRYATIGQSASILPGIEIGENSIIGANSVVTKSVPEHVLVMGIPARVVRNLREEEIVK